MTSRSINGDLTTFGVQRTRNLRRSDFLWGQRLPAMPAIYDGDDSATAVYRARDPGDRIARRESQARRDRSVKSRREMNPVPSISDKPRKVDQTVLGCSSSGEAADDWILDSAVLTLENGFRICVLAVINGATGEILALPPRPSLHRTVAISALFMLFRDWRRPARLLLSRSLDPSLGDELCLARERLDVSIDTTTTSLNDSGLIEDLSKRLSRACCGVPRYRMISVVRRTTERWRRTHNVRLRRQLRSKGQEKQR